MDIVSHLQPTSGPLDFDLIDEIIRKDSEQSVVPPRPRPPPAELSELQHSQHPRMHRQSPPQTSKPVLVARGTGHPPTRSFPQPLQQLSDSNDMASAHPSRTAPSSSNSGQGLCLPTSRSSGGVSSQSRGDTSILERILEKPRLVVVEEPKDRSMRFRYECEGRSAGSILGVSSTDTNKTQPAIEIQGPIDHIKRVTVTVSLVTKDLPHRPHPHCLVGKDCPNALGICVVTLNPHNNRRHSFANLGIQCVRRKELDLSLQKRRSLNIDPFQTGHSKGIEDLDMNAVRLCFQCELEWEDGRKDSLSPVVSSTIYDKKATTTSQLKITCLNQYKGPCNGKTEIYMLCDKVQKDDIEIRFSRGSWKANGEFAQTDVHRQIAIVFKTPPYQDQNITEEVDVSVVLRRISDQMESEPVTFTYLPYNPDPYEVKRKCRIKSGISFREKPCQTVAQPFQFSQPACFNTVPDTNTNNHEEDMALLNQLLEMPAILDAINETNFEMTYDIEEKTEGTSTFASMDININNFGAYSHSQDFSQFSDHQFNMLVNDFQTLQSEPHDGLTNAVQVKKEEQL